MKRSTLVVMLFVAFVLYLLFRAKKASAAVPTSAQPVGSAAATRKPTTAETLLTGGMSLLQSMLQSGSPSSVQVGTPTWSLQVGGSSDWSSVDVSPDFSYGSFSGTGSMASTQTPDFSSGAFSGSGGWG
jgi:hypothetical protein